MEDHNNCTCDDCTTEEPKVSFRKMKRDINKERLQKNKAQRKARRQQRRKK